MTRTPLAPYLSSLLLLAGLIGNGACASSETAPAQSPAAAVNERQSPTRTERLAAEVPDGWQQLLDRKVGTLYLAEYYPLQDIQAMVAAKPEQAATLWNEKLSIEVLSGADTPDPLVVIEGLAEDQADSCESPSQQPIFAGFENGYPTAVHMLQCPRARTTTTALLTMVKVIQGQQALYTISRIWRVPAGEIPTAPLGEEAPPAPDVEVDPAAVAAWANTLTRFKLCDPADPQHPCS